MILQKIEANRDSFVVLFQPAKPTPSSACTATSFPCPSLSDLSPILPTTQPQVGFFPPPPAAPFPSDRAEVYDVCQCCGSPTVNARGQARPRLWESSFTKWPCLVGCPKPWAHGDVLPRLLSSRASHEPCTPPLGAQHLFLWARDDAKSSLSHLLTHWEELEAKGFSPMAKSRPCGHASKNNFSWAVGLCQLSADSFPESGFLGELWCWFVARQNKQALENQLRTKLLEDPRKWLAYF